MQGYILNIEPLYNNYTVNDRDNKGIKPILEALPYSLKLGDKLAVDMISKTMETILNRIHASSRKLD